MEKVQLTRFSHGSGCGCKISPKVLDQILQHNEAFAGDGDLLVGNQSRDDAAVYDLHNGTGLIATTDFFMPVVDDPADFGRIAAANAISDVYAMGGKPVLALAILGWPVDKLDPALAREVVEGARDICRQAGIPLAGGHSIDSPEPIFGLAVNGLADLFHIKRNDTAIAGDLLFLTKPLGIGILTTAAKKNLLHPGDLKTAIAQMVRLNRVGEALGKLPEVHAMTDVTGFGLLGHLGEMAGGSGCSAEIRFSAVPRIQADLEGYIGNGCVPGGTGRNWESYGGNIGDLGFVEKTILADPQTSGGLLIALGEPVSQEFSRIMEEFGLKDLMEPIGKIIPRRGKLILVE